MRTSWRTPRVIPRNSRTLRVRPPSNRMTPTAKAITGCRKGPKSSAGERMPNTGPASSPATLINTMAGRLKRQASHCEPMPSTPISATLKTRPSGIPRSCRSFCSRTEHARPLRALAYIKPPPQRPQGWPRPASVWTCRALDKSCGYGRQIRPDPAQIRRRGNRQSTPPRCRPPGLPRRYLRNTGLKRGQQTTRRRVGAASATGAFVPFAGTATADTRARLSSDTRVAAAAPCASAKVTDGEAFAALLGAAASAATAP